MARAAGLIVEEVRRQFRIPGLLEGKVKPDYKKAVGICTVAAQKELTGLALLAVAAFLILRGVSQRRIRKSQKAGQDQIALVPHGIVRTRRNFHVGHRQRAESLVI